MPKLFINRRSAAEHRADPTQDSDAKCSIFNQVSIQSYILPSYHKHVQGKQYKESSRYLAATWVLIPGAPLISIPLPGGISSCDVGLNRELK